MAKSKGSEKRDAKIKPTRILRSPKQGTIAKGEAGGKPKTNEKHSYGPICNRVRKRDKERIEQMKSN